MNLAVLHYHLNRGGVTRVIQNHLQALASVAPSAWPERVVIVYGGRRAAWDDTLAEELPFPVELCAIPELDYDLERTPAAPAQLAGQIREQLARRGFDSSSSVLHVHNHGLGKNLAWPLALAQLARDGWRLLLQIHDFAEDLRPANYARMVRAAGSADRLQSQLYPQAAQIVYTTLNGRDLNVLKSAGIEPGQIHWLPNAVVETGPDETERLAARAELQRAFGVGESRPYVLYPVRGIRRKNLGEFLLWAAVLEQATFGVTLEPLNPQERPAYDAWQARSESLGLSVLFGVGGRAGLSLAANYAACDAVITTSLAEGFGMVFLEASLGNRPLIGRDLPSITQDFVTHGACFPGLAPELAVPRDWIDVDALRSHYAQLLRDLRTAFGLSDLAPDAMQRQIDTAIGSGTTIDFARLDVSGQHDIIQRVLAEAEGRPTLRQLNPRLHLPDTAHQEVMNQNRRVIRDHFSVDVVGQRLSQFYQQLLQADVGPVSFDASIGQAVLTSFVLPQALHPVRLAS